MEKLPARFRCEGCGRVMTVEKDGQITIDSHRDVHGLVVNIGPDLTAREERTVTVYRVQIKNQQNEWHDAGHLKMSPTAAVTELYDVIAILQRSGLTRYTHARIQMEEKKLSVLGSEVSI